MNHTTITISTTRADQLRRVAQHKQVSTADLLDTWIRNQWREIGETGLPGFDIAATRDVDTGEAQVVFATLGTEPVFLTPDHARAIAAGLGDLLSGVAPKFVVSARCAGFRAAIFGYRQGRGFSLKVADNLDRDTKAVPVSGLSVTVARDLAEAFEFYATKADALPAQPINH